MSFSRSYTPNNSPLDAPRIFPHCRRAHYAFLLEDAFYSTGLIHSDFQREPSVWNDQLRDLEEQVGNSTIECEAIAGRVVDCRNINII